jgi:hypothetical protein
MSQEHPILCLFGDSVRATFPLILIIGREPNADQPVGNFIGTYDFRRASRCAFWNTSYGVLGRIAGMPTAALKQHCIRQGGSPIVYADALPQGILNRVGDKQQRRAALAASGIARHIDNLFSHHALLDRVALVIISGLGGVPFAGARESIEQHCRERNLPLARVAFFYPTNTTRIGDQLSTDHKAIISRTLSEFLRAQADPWNRPEEWLADAADLNLP